MISIDNLRQVLDNIGFTYYPDIDAYYQEYGCGGNITVDFKNKEILYAPLDDNFKEGEFPSKEKEANGFIIHRDTTLNFSANENFVCLVCVHYLMSKDYEPKHIIFEPAFKVGHNNKPSYGDILVFDKEYKPLVLIENKTYGSEFNKEWNLMQKNGGQLFSYLGPIVNNCGFCQNLTLFTSDFDGERILYKSNIVILKDNEEYLATLEAPKTFKNAQGKFFEVWNETYAKAFSTKGLFEPEIDSYTIGKEKYTIKDLEPFSYSEIQEVKLAFETILRYHAITDFEHTFYILVDLFLCKITDEINNPEDLQFTYRGITRDTPMQYCNRLLQLYQQGKKQLFGIDVINKSDKDISDIFESTDRVKNGLYHELVKLFNEIKFYNIKKFNFISVENKEDFELNFNILIEITALIQDINLAKSDTNHFFGDLFEKLLNKNVHQTAGQFFTPLPIVNFIVDSLPCFLPAEKFKVLDYACGAGHFLTEFYKHYNFARLYGIEKSQNLSQVAKIATILNGCSDAKIAFKDALSVIDTNDFRYKGFDFETFDCVIANPPYSVKGFLDTLDAKDRDQFELTKEIDEKSYPTNDNIEYFFVELAEKVLKNYGLCAIVLPSSILDNEDALSTRIRSFIFAHFNLLSIVELNSKTFGQTGKNTIIIYMQKVKKNARGLINSFIQKKDITQYTTHLFINDYCERQGYSIEAFTQFIQDSVLTEEIENTDIFNEYKAKFKEEKITKTTLENWFKESKFYSPNLKGQEFKKKILEFSTSVEYKILYAQEQRKRFVNFAKSIEIGKLTVYVQIADNMIGLLKSPPEKIKGKSNKESIVKFLGYDWSNRRGNEGISYVTENSSENEIDNSIDNIITPLFNPKNDNDKNKFAFVLRKHNTKYSKGIFLELVEDPELPENFENLYSEVSLVDLMDFSRANFLKKIDISGIKRVDLKSDYDIFTLGKICDVKIGGTPSRKNSANFNGEYPWVSIGEMEGQIITTTKEKLSELGVSSSNVKKIPKNTTLLSFKLSIGKTAIAGVDLYTNEAIAGLIPKDDSVLNKYLYFLFNSKIINLQSGGNKAFGKTLNSKYLRDEVKIPVPPTDLQDTLISQCEAIQLENESIKQAESVYLAKLQNVFYSSRVVIKNEKEE